MVICSQVKAACGNPSTLPSATLFVQTIYHLSGLTTEGTHLSGPANVATLLWFNYDAACFQETAKTNKTPFLEAGRRWCAFMSRFKPDANTKTVTSLHDISNPSAAGSMHALQIDGHWQVKLISVGKQCGLIQLKACHKPLHTNSHMHVWMHVSAGGGEPVVFFEDLDSGLNHGWSRFWLKCAKNIRFTFFPISTENKDVIPDFTEWKLWRITSPMKRLSCDL